MDSSTSQSESQPWAWACIRASDPCAPERVLEEALNWVEAQGGDVRKIIPQASGDILVVFRRGGGMDDLEKREAPMPQWSPPDTPERWARVFGISTKTFIRWVHQGRLKIKKLSDRSYQIALKDLPLPAASGGDGNKRT